MVTETEGASVTPAGILLPTPDVMVCTVAWLSFGAGTITVVALRFF